MWHLLDSWDLMINEVLMCKIEEAWKSECWQQQSDHIWAACPLRNMWLITAAGVATYRKTHWTGQLENSGLGSHTVEKVLSHEGDTLFNIVLRN